MLKIRQEGIKLRLKAKATIAIIVIVAVLVSMIALSITVLSYNKIYKGVYVQNVSLGGLTRDEAIQVLTDNFINVFQNEGILLKCGDNEKNLDLTGKVFVDTNAILDEAYNIGRRGNHVNRVLKAVHLSFRNVKLPLQITYDTAYLDNSIREFTDRIEKENLFFEIAPELDKVKIKISEDATIVDINATRNVLIKNLENTLFDPVDAVVVKGEITPNIIAGRINREAVNATCEVVNNKTILTPHVVGIKLDETILKQKLDSGDKEFEVPLIKSMPEVTSDEFETKLFTDILGQCTTNYNSSILGRTKNVTLAANAINGTIIGPGHDFSFNKVVGERTEARGYKTGIVYVNGRMEDGLGGGICQVSSTLYTAQLYADLQTINRRNHMFTVTYLPFGQDATVAYGSQDYMFRNNTDYPIKIVTTIGNGTLKIQILGTKEKDRPMITIINNVIGTTPFAQRTEVDPLLKPGHSKIKQNGSNGLVVDSYKAYWLNGKEIKRVFLHRSTYSPCDKIILVGPSWGVQSESTDETDTINTPSVSESGEPNASKSPSASASPHSLPEAAKSPKPSLLPTLDPNIPISENGI